MDGDEVMKRVEDMSSEELKEVIERLISMNPANLLYLTVPAGEKKASEKLLAALDKEIKSRLKRIEYTYADAGFVDDFAKFIKVNEDALTKEQIFYILEFLVKNCEEYGYFYDDYSDSYFGDVIFENLCDAFVKKDLEEKDFEKLKKLRSEDNYEMLGPFFNRITAVESAAKLADFEEYIHEFLDERSYVEFLINCGLIDKARRLIEASESLDEGSRFRLYLRIDKGDAIEFALGKGLYSSLMQYYHEIGAHDEAVGLFKEVVSDEEKRVQLKHDLYLYRDIFDSINKTEKKEGLGEVLRSLFEICYSLKYYGLCVDVGVKLSDKELMRKLISQKRGYDFGVDAKIKLLDYLKEDYKEEVEKELKELAESLIEEKKNYAYGKAAECVFLLKKMMGKEEWEKYVKGLYSMHSRKMNLWLEFTRRGVSLKKKTGMVTIEDRGYDIAKSR
ncbi:MAG: hypothetical protein OIN66_09475 [Candidatus Methanoperedens sp.]|nr:hypothetical protein [Candidatus Methanoperedens sp.]